MVNKISNLLKEVDLKKLEKEMRKTWCKSSLRISKNEKSSIWKFIGTLFMWEFKKKDKFYLQFNYRKICNLRIKYWFLIKVPLNTIIIQTQLQTSTYFNNQQFICLILVFIQIKRQLLLLNSSTLINFILNSNNNKTLKVSQEL